MGVCLSTARYLAPASFIYDFAAQQYGINSTPSMKAIHDAHLSFWSPQPYFIAAFFFPQQFFQLAWLWKLWKLDPKDPRETRELEQIRRYVPYYALGNVMIGSWMFFWNAEMLKTSNIFVIVNSLAQLWYVLTQLERMDTSSWPSILNHVVAKTFAGIGVLDFIHNMSVAYFDHNTTPALWVRIVTGLGFAGLGAMSDWILGGCLVYDLVGLSVGQSMYSGDSSWSGLLGGYAVGTAAVVGLRNWFIPPYTKGKRDEYTQVRDEVDDRA